MEIVHPLTGEITATPVSLDMPDGIQFEEWRSLGEKLNRAYKGVNWWIGDWWIGGHRYGERAKVAAEGIFDREFGSLMNLASVCRAFETSRRREVLSFTHHAEVASIPAAEADALLDVAEAEALSSRAVRALVNQRKAVGEQPSLDTCTVEDLRALVMRGKRFGTIYADPPWLYDNQGTRAATGNHYGGLTVDELCELPVRELAADDAHLHLWTTNGFLFECPKIFEAWGFEFKSSFVWIKPSIGTGNYWRNSHEILLTAVRGDAKRFRDRSLKSWLDCDRGPHSAKPEQARHFIEKASIGPFLELFGRTPAPGWTVWGNQIRRDLLLHDVEELAA